ncbi:unnamed protein product, partial [Closterium sp. NIES-64]
MSRFFHLATPHANHHILMPSPLSSCTPLLPLLPPKAPTVPHVFLPPSSWKGRSWQFTIPTPAAACAWRVCHLDVARVYLPSNLFIASHAVNSAAEYFAECDACQNSHVAESPRAALEEHLLPATCYLPPVTCHLLLATCYLPPVTCHLLPATCYLPPVTCHLIHALLPPQCALLRCRVGRDRTGSPAATNPTRADDVAYSGAASGIGGRSRLKLRKVSGEDCFRGSHANGAGGAGCGDEGVEGGDAGGVEQGRRGRGMDFQALEWGAEQASEGGLVRQAGQSTGAALSGPMQLRQLPHPSPLRSPPTPASYPPATPC